MKNDQEHARRQDGLWTRDDFEFAASLKSAIDVPDAPPALYRPIPWHGSPWVLGLAVLPLVIGAWAFFSFVYPPPLVRDALVHEYREATLRGDFQPDKRPMFDALGVPAGAALPGLLQLQRPCEIDGRTAYHVTTFIEKGGGMVTILAFDRPVSEVRPGQQGRWMGRHWRVAEMTPGRTVLLLADNARVLTETERFLKKEG
jgi:hypothetical protein